MVGNADAYSEVMSLVSEEMDDVSGDFVMDDVKWTSSVEENTVMCVDPSDVETVGLVWIGLSDAVIASVVGNEVDGTSVEDDPGDS